MLLGNVVDDRRVGLLFGEQGVVGGWYFYLSCFQSLGAAHWVAQCWRWKTRLEGGRSVKLLLRRKMVKLEERSRDRMGYVNWHILSLRTWPLFPGQRFER